MLTFDDFLLVAEDSVSDVAYLSPDMVLTKPEIETIKTKKALLYAFGIISKRQTEVLHLSQ